MLIVPRWLGSCVQASSLLLQSLQLMDAPLSYPTRQHLHLRIDPVSHLSSTSPPSADFVANTPNGPSKGSTLCSVLCMHDFRSDDPDHLPFCKYEILDIVRKEESGWWAAVRSDGDQIGWIPQAFVNTLSDEMAERLRRTRQEFREREYNAGQLYTSASASSHSTSPLHETAGHATTSPIRSRRRMDERERVSLTLLLVSLINCISQQKTPSPQTALSRAQDTPSPSSHSDPPYRNMFRYRKPSHELHSKTLHSARSSLGLDNSTAFPPSSSEEDGPQSHNRAVTVPEPAVKRRPSTRLRTLHEIASFAGLSSSYTAKEGQQIKPTRPKPDPQLSTEKPLPKSPQSEKPAVDPDGYVFYGTVDELVEKLTSDKSNLDPASELSPVFPRAPH